MNKKIILLSVLGVILAGCIGTVSAECFDFSPSTGEISGKILESEIKWNTEQVLYTNSSVSDGFNRSKDNSYSYVEGEFKPTVYSNCSLKIKLNNAAGNQLDNIKKLLNDSDSYNQNCKLKVNGDYFAEELNYTLGVNSMNLEGDILTLNLSNPRNQDVNVSSESGNATIESGTIWIEDIKIVF